MNKKFVALIPLLLVFFVSCTNLAEVDTSISPSSSITTKPEMNVVSEVNVGCPILEQVSTSKKEKITLLDSFGMLNPKGDYYLIGKSSEGNKIYQNSNFNKFYFVYPQLLENQDGNVMLDDSKKILSDLEYTKSVEDMNDSFVKEFVYNGVEGNLVHFTYREYQDSTIRSAYTLDLVYDLNKGNTINLQDSEVEIISCDNQSIKYKVLKATNL